MPRPLKELPEEPPEGVTSDEFKVYLPWHIGRRYRQLIKQNDLVANYEFRMMVKRWIQEHESD